MGNIISMQLFPLKLCFIRVMLGLFFFFIFLPKFCLLNGMESITNKEF